MLPGASEAATVAKVGGSVIQGLQQANKPLPWPNAREALLELHAILDEWYIRSVNTSQYVFDRLGERIYDRKFREEHPDQEPPKIGIGYNIGWISVVKHDIDGVLDSKAPLLWRWQPSSRRAAARRSLRSVLTVYAPELLEQFEHAVQARVDWLKEYQNSFDRWFDFHTEEDAAQLINEMDATSQGLVEVASSLRKFIIDNFPLSDID